MDNWFQSKWFIRILALALAITLYIFVNIEINSDQSESAIPGRNNQTETLEEVPVDIKIDSDNYVVSGVPEFATVSLEGAQSILIPTILNRNISVYVDLIGLEEGKHRVEILHDVSDDLKVYIEPKTIDITIEERANEEFPITVDFLNTDQLPAGYEVGDYELDESTVTITTSRSIMEQIGIVKVYVDVGELDKPIRKREVPINVYDSQGNELSVRLDRETAVISVDIVNPSKTVPLAVEKTGELPEGLSLISMDANLKEVEIYAKSDVLEEVESIPTEEINLSELSESGTIEVPLAPPEGVNTGEVETIEVTVEVEETRVIEGIPIEEEELESGQAATFINPENAEMDITITGNQSLISTFTPDDFRLTVNLAGLEPGEHLVPITIEWDEVEDVTVTGEHTEASLLIE